MKTLTVRVPASSANLGPAFDCLGLALDLWNESTFDLSGQQNVVQLSGEGQQTLPPDDTNLVLQAFHFLYAHNREKIPPAVHLTCHNRIPLNSGLGSSSAAIATGLMAANELLGKPNSPGELLNLGAQMEGHADNLAAALFGSLVLVLDEDGQYKAIPLDCPALRCIILLPDIALSTQATRKSLPKKVTLEQAVFNIGHSLSLIQALKNGDIKRMQSAMQDRLHQEKRLKLIPGAREALQSAAEAGAAAALSGAGPGLIAFVEEGREKPVTEAMRAPFAQRGISTRQYLLDSSQQGAQLSTSQP